MRGLEHVRLLLARHGADVPALDLSDAVAGRTLGGTAERARVAARKAIAAALARVSDVDPALGRLWLLGEPGAGRLRQPSAGGSGSSGSPAR
jgi:hypothetical protein